MRKFFWFLCFAFLAFGQDAFAQRTITGKVTDKKNVAVAGASVVIKGTTIGTVTDNNGQFTLTMDKGSALVASFGAESQEMPVKPTDKTVTVAFKTTLKDLQKKAAKASGKKK